jgi:hypothetical protein
MLPSLIEKETLNIFCEKVRERLFLALFVVNTGKKRFHENA